MSVMYTSTKVDQSWVLKLEYPNAVGFKTICRDIENAPIERPVYGVKDKFNVCEKFIQLVSVAKKTVEEVVEALSSNESSRFFNCKLLENGMISIPETLEEQQI